MDVLSRRRRVLCRAGLRSRDYHDRRGPGRRAQAVADVNTQQLRALTAGADTSDDIFQYATDRRPSWCRYVPRTLRDAWRQLTPRERLLICLVAAYNARNAA